MLNPLTVEVAQITMLKILKKGEKNHVFLLYIKRTENLKRIENVTKFGATFGR